MTIKIGGLDVLINDDTADEILRHKWGVQSRRRSLNRSIK
jgi:hypothetical protein